MQDFNVIIAKYYLPDELFVYQVEEVVDMLIDCLAVRLPRIQAVNKANQFVAKYYLDIANAEAGDTIFWKKQRGNLRNLLNADKRPQEKPSCFGSLKSICSDCDFYIQCLLKTNDIDLGRGF